jgi:hypothetical protein
VRPLNPLCCFSPLITATLVHHTPHHHRPLSRAMRHGWSAKNSATARAGNRLFWCLSALRAHTKAPYKINFHRETLRVLNRPKAARTGRRVAKKRRAGGGEGVEGEAPEVHRRRQQPHAGAEPLPAADRCGATAPRA